MRVPEICLRSPSAPKKKWGVQTQSAPTPTKAQTTIRKHHHLGLLPCECNSRGIQIWKLRLPVTDRNNGKSCVSVRSSDTSESNICLIKLIYDTT